MKVKNYPGAKIKEDISSDIRIVSLPKSNVDNARWKLGGCPRCFGDVFLDSEDGQVLGHCLQCGYVGVRLDVVMSETMHGE